MGGSANDSSRTPFLPPSPNLISATNTPPSLSVQVTVDIAMDQTVTPALTSFEVVVDGVPETPTSFIWFTATVFDLGFATAATTDLVVNLLTTDSDLRSLEGSFMRAPQSVIGFP